MCNIFSFMYWQMWNEEGAALPNSLRWRPMFTLSLSKCLYETNFPYERGHSITQFLILTNCFKNMCLGYYFIWYWELETFFLLFHFELVTRKFYSCLLFRASKFFLLLFSGVTNSEIRFFWIFRVSNSGILFSLKIASSPI